MFLRKEKPNAFHEDRLTLVPVQKKGNNLSIHSWCSLLHNLETICAFNRLTPVYWENGHDPFETITGQISVWHELLLCYWKKWREYGSGSIKHTWVWPNDFFSILFSLLIRKIALFQKALFQEFLIIRKWMSLMVSYLVYNWQGTHCDFSESLFQREG